MYDESTHHCKITLVIPEMILSEKVIIFTSLNMDTYNEFMSRQVSICNKFTHFKLSVQFSVVKLKVGFVEDEI